MVLNENYLSCIHKYIKKINLKNEGKQSNRQVTNGGNLTYIEHIGQFLMRANLSKETTKMENKILSSNINPYCLCEIVWFNGNSLCDFKVHMYLQNTPISAATHPRISNLVPN